MAYKSGSVYTKEGTPEELSAFVAGLPFILNTNYAWTGTAGSYCVFVETIIDN